MNSVDEYGIFILDETNIETHHVLGIGWPKYDLGRQFCEPHPQHDRARQEYTPVSSVGRWAMNPAMAQSRCNGRLGPQTETDAPSTIIPPRKRSSPDYYRPNVTVARIIELAEKADNRPIIMCEYAHSMGDGTGNLSGYWAAVHPVQTAARWLVSMNEPGDSPLYRVVSNGLPMVATWG